MIAETYWQLMSDPAHLAFEITLTLIQDVLIGMILWPWVRLWIERHDKDHHDGPT